MGGSRGWGWVAAMCGAQPLPRIQGRAGQHAAHTCPVVPQGQQGWHPCGGVEVRVGGSRGWGWVAATCATAAAYPGQSWPACGPHLPSRPTITGWIGG